MTSNGPGSFDHGHYVPILLTRQGERHALREMPDEVKAHLTPLFVAHQVPTDLETGLPKKSVEEHVEALAAQLASDWGQQPAFVDIRHLLTSSTPVDPASALYSIIAAAQDHGLHLSPAISGSPDDGTREAALRAVADFKLDLCLRLSPDEWANLGTPEGDGRLLSLLSACRQAPEETHLVLDAEELPSSARLAATALRTAIKGLPHMREWHSLTMAGTGMPSGTADVGANNSADLPRTEWHVWRQIRESGGSHRTPTFGDFGVQHPDPLSDFDPRYMDSSAQLRYTTSQSWFVARGRGVKSKGNIQIRRLAAEVAAHEEFSGRDFSWGDTWISDCAAAECSPGNQGVWRKATTNHHLTRVVDQIATLLGS